MNNSLKLLICASFFQLAWLPSQDVLAVGPEPPGAGISLQAGDYQETLSSETAIQWMTFDPQLQIRQGYRSEIENVRSGNDDPERCWLISSPTGIFSTAKVDSLTVDSLAVDRFVEDLARRFNIDPINARFKIENDRVTEFASSQSGRKLDTAGAAGLIRTLLLERSGIMETEKIVLDLPFQVIEPEIKDDNSLGIKGLIGEGVSNFKGSPKNRIFNIRVATERFNGILIKPGEEFSFVTVLGPVDGEHGYLPELVIKKDKTEPEFGGGICQVSTTAFRAAIYSGLKITARRNHAYPVSYYNPQGMDATVYVPRPDLRFVNNTPAYILIQTKIEGTELKFQFYGTNDGRKIEVEGPRVIERRPDGGMRTTFTQKVSDQSGNVLFSDVFNSNYDSPSKYPHPGQEPVLTKQPDGWSDGEWKRYKKEHGLN